MAFHTEHTWISEQASGIPRSERRSCRYRTYIPDPLMGRAFFLSGQVAADVADAEAALARFDERARALVDTEVLARILLRAESVASSRIEGLEIGPRRLLRAEAAREMGAAYSDVGADEVLGNIDALHEAVMFGARGEPITVEDLLSVHERLLAGSSVARFGGQIRTVQNWIGGSGYNPCAAEYIPPPAEEVEPLLQDLVAFCNSDDLPVVVQAALAHAQFETIHPFVDGNGRVGRALIYLILRKRGLSTSAMPPISLVLATRADAYIEGLVRFRHEGESTSEQAVAGLNDWVGTFAAACLRAVADAEAYERRCTEVVAEWRARLGRVRAGSAVDQLLGLLPGAPIISVQSAVEATGKSKQQVHIAVQRLVEGRVLKQTTAGRRNRIFEAPEIIRAFTDLERQLASPAGDTRRSPRLG